MIELITLRYYAKKGDITSVFQAKALFCNSLVVSAYDVTIRSKGFMVFPSRCP